MKIIRLIHKPAAGYPHRNYNPQSFCPFSMQKENNYNVPKRLLYTINYIDSMPLLTQQCLTEMDPFDKPQTNTFSSIPNQATRQNLMDRNKRVVA